MHRIIDDRIEKYDAYVVVFSKQDCRNEECLSRREMDTKGGWSVGAWYNSQIVKEWSQGVGGPGQYCPSALSDHPHSPHPARRGVNMWAVGADGPVQQIQQMR